MLGDQVDVGVGDDRCDVTAPGLGDCAGVDARGVAGVVSERVVDGLDHGERLVITERVPVLVELGLFPLHADKGARVASLRLCRGVLVRPCFGSFPVGASPDRYAGGGCSVELAPHRLDLGEGGGRWGSQDVPGRLRESDVVQGGQGPLQGRDLSDLLRPFGGSGLRLQLGDGGLSRPRRGPSRSRRADKRRGAAGAPADAAGNGDRSGPS